MVHVLVITLARVIKCYMYVIQISDILVQVVLDVLAMSFTRV